MSNYYYFLVITLSFCLICCSDSSSPVEAEMEIIHQGGCTTEGIEIEFSDTCSYSFILTFLSNFDSVRITQTFLGNIFHLYADSADYDYWVDYFENDSTIQNIFVGNSTDSLILEIRVTGEKSTEEEKERFLNIEHLTLIEIEQHPKLVYIDVPENKESEWRKIFSQYSFISHVYVMGVCFDK